MIDQDRKPFFELIANVAAFYRQDFSKFAGGVWWEAMKPYDFNAVADALNRHCVNPDVGQFMPKPADVVRMLQGSTQDSALVAWAKVDRAIRTVGTHRSVAFDDPLVHRVLVEMGGWIQLGAKTDDDWPFLKNEFVNRYRGYRGRSEVPEYPPVLIGVAEAQNSQQSLAHREPPTLIGNQALAERVALGGTGKPLLAIGQMTPKAAAKVLQLTAGEAA
jgi:hypothetical protein